MSGTTGKHIVVPGAGGRIMELAAINFELLPGHKAVSVITVCQETRQVNVLQTKDATIDDLQMVRMVIDQALEVIILKKQHGIA